jgi:hypothetical protein
MAEPARQDRQHHDQPEIPVARAKLAMWASLPSSRPASGHTSPVCTGLPVTGLTPQNRVDGKGRSAPMASSTCWNTPREIMTSAYLERDRAPVPDDFRAGLHSVAITR